MGSSKTANALITRFNYQERDMQVWLIKPSVDDRDGANIIRSRIGLEAVADVITPDADIFALFEAGHKDCNTVIADECQFFTPEQVDPLEARGEQRTLQAADPHRLYPDHEPRRY